METGHPTTRPKQRGAALWAWSVPVCARPFTSLSFIGLIRARAGEGSLVAEQPSAYLTSPWLNRGLLTTEKEFNEFAEARLVLETETAALCASRITEAELNDMGRIVAQVKNSMDDVEKFRGLDLAFHLAIGAAAKNDVLNELLKSVRERMWDLIGKSLLLRQGMKQAASQHAKVLAAFRSGIRQELAKLCAST